MTKTIQLNATGETITFTKSRVHTNGAQVETVVTLPGTGEGPQTHRHVLQTEHFEAIEGRLGVDCGDKRIILEPGQSFTVPADTLHRCYAVDGTEIRFRATFTPALNIEYILTEIFESCNRKNAKDPSPFDACYVLRQTRGEYFLGDVPALVQKTIFPLTAIFGKLFGLVKARPKSAYETSSEPVFAEEAKTIL